MARVETTAAKMPGSPQLFKYYYAMIEGNHYIEVVKKYFQFLITEFNFMQYGEKVRGNAFYDVQYQDQARIVSISYENIEAYLLVIIFMLQNGELPNYDDKTKTLHLNKLNELVLSRIGKSEIGLNNEYFSEFKTTNDLEKKLLKSAKELRLCLKYYNWISLVEGCFNS